MDDLTWKKNLNRNVAIKQSIWFTIVEFIRIIPFMVITLAIVNITYKPNTITIKETIVFGTIILVILYIYRTFQNYIFLRNSLDQQTIISDRKFNKYARSYFIQCINTYSMLSERFKLKIDIIKSFSPVPIIVYLLGLLMTNNHFNTSTSIRKFMKSLKISNSLHSVYALITTITIIFYMWLLIANYSKYKNTQQRLLDCKNAYDEIKEKSEIDKKEKEKSNK